MKYLKNLIAVVLCVIFFSQGVFASENISWLNPEKFSERQGYLIDRGELCKYLVNTYIHITKTTPSAIECKFTDVDPSAQPYIAQANALGLINGISSTQFSPNETVTKADFAVMLYQLVKKVYPNANLTGGESIQFPEDVPSYAFVPLQFAFSRGIITKDANGSLNANAKLSLGDAITILNKALKAAPDFKVVFNKFNTKRAYLTFDDGVSANTITILDTLKKYNVKASFFITGKSDPEILKRIVQEGHIIGNHTASHDYKYIYSSIDNFWADFNEEQEYLKSVTGKAPIFVRFPGGSNNTVSTHYGNKQIMNTLTAQMKEKGYLYVDWNVSSGDASGKTLPKNTIVNNVLEGCKGKSEAIVLMHQISSKTTTAQALPEIIEGLQKMGFDIVALSDSSYLPQFLK